MKATGKRTTASLKAGIIIPLIFLGAAGHSIAMAQSPGTFSVTSRMTTPRSGHTATLLPNGKVLVAGGVRGIAFGGLNVILATAELYDPSTGAFTATGNMTTPRTLHTATLLPDGRVLIAGGLREVPGSGPNLLLASAEIYDPSTGTFAATGDMISDHHCHQANLLGNGKVLFAGGAADRNDRVPYAELYDPATGTFAATGMYTKDTFDFNACQGAASSLLPDGRVLIVWQDIGTELYDPGTGSFTPTGNPITQGYNGGLPTATLLMNGKVLVAGGAGVGDLSPTSAELYDSRTGTFTATGNMITGHVGHTATLLPDGTVLMAGSFLFPGELANAELYGPVTGAFNATNYMITARGNGQTATLLNNGQVLVTGGYSPYPAITPNAEIYHPVVLVPAPQLFAVSGDGRGQGAILHAGTARAVTASDPGITGEVLEIYGTGLKDGSVIPPQVAIGGRLAEILYFGNAPGFTGLNQVNVRVPSGVEPGSAVAVRLTYLGRPSNEVNIGVQ
jgi:hypothetical protein